MLNTKGGDLIKDENGKVCDIYATNADGETIQIDAKAVIMACGGFEESAKLLKMKGYNPGRCVFDGITGHDGSGIEAAWRAGAKSWLDQASLLENPTNCAMGASTMVLWMNMNGREIVVNGRGERFFDETALQKNRAYPMLAIKQQWRDGSWQIFDQQVLDAAYASMGPDAVVIDEEGNDIPGFYVVGTCGTELWPDYYSICMPGAANAYNVHSGRRAVEHAEEHVL